MRRFCLLMLLAGTMPVAMAQATLQGPTSAPAEGTASPVLAERVLAEGEVRRLDPASGRVTLRHGEIRNIDMPAMTMVFRAADPALLANLKVGDRVRFSAERVGANFVVTYVELRN